MVPIAPVTAQLSAQAQPGRPAAQSTQLNWKSADAVGYFDHQSWERGGERRAHGKPDAPTTYELVAKGPGGKAEQTATIDVNTQPTATLALSQPEVRYHKIGDKVVQQDSATLDWSASNASQVTLNPLGSVATHWKPKHCGLAEPKQRRPHQSRRDLHAQRGQCVRRNDDANGNPAHRWLDRSSAAGNAGERLLSHGLSRTPPSESRPGRQPGRDAGQGGGHIQEQRAVRPREQKLMVVGHADVRGSEEIQSGAERTARRSREGIFGFTRHRRRQD